MTIERPLWMDPNPATGETPVFSARQDRAIIAALFTEGIADIQAGDLAVTQRAAGANMTVTVAAGAAYVAGDDTARQGTYRVVVTAAESVTIPGAPSSQSRIDLVVLRVYDGSANGGTRHGAAIEVVTGTAGATPTAPALPPTSIPLARVTVAAGQSAVVTSNIADLRTQSAANVLKVGVQAEALTTAQIDALTGASAFSGRVVTNTDTDTLEVFGSDGVPRSQTALFFGDGSDGTVTLSASTTLTRDMYYRTLTVPAGVTLTAGGYRIYASELLTVNGTIRSSPDTPVSGVTVSPVNTQFGTVTPVLTPLAVGGSGATGGAGGHVAASSTTPIAPGAGVIRATGSALRALLALLGGGATAGGIGGNGGRGDYYSPEEGSGTRSDFSPGGSAGGALIIFARRIEGGGTISSAGSPGAAGAAGSSSTNQYGRADIAANGGGGGGGGGAIVLVSQRGRRGTVTVTAAGGAGGPGGAAGPQGGAGSAGAAGSAGSITEHALMS